MRAAERAVAARLKELRAEWWVWKRGYHSELSHIDYCLLPCADRCGRCEGCLSAAYRADRRAEITAAARRLFDGGAA